MNRIFICVIFASLAVPRATTAQDLDRLTELWRNGRYEPALDGLLSYRDTASYGRTEIIDYMIGTSACRISGQEADGRDYLAWVLDHYSLSSDSRDKVQHEIDNCTGAHGGQLVASLITAEMSSTSGGTRGKMYYNLTSDPDLPVANESVRVIRKITPAEYNARLYATGDPTRSLSALRVRLGDNYRAAASGAFLVASKTHSAHQLADIGRQLDGVLAFFLHEYSLRRPPHYITVYLAYDAGEMRELAEKVHGIRVQAQSIGYSFRDDLGMVGAIPGRQIGTLLHELFHLVVRRDFGDIPPWLDEGVSALYEVSETSNGQTRGVPNWRGGVLERLRDNTPSLASLVAMDWPTFDDRRGGDLGTQAANHATARYFALYLQESDDLVSVFQAFRNRDPQRDRTDPATLLSATLDRPLAWIQSDYDRWLDGQLGTRTRQPVQSETKNVKGGKY